MGWFTSMKIETLEDLFLQQLKDLYDAEHRISEALPKMEKAAHNPDLAHAFATHREETTEHIARLRQIFNQIGAEPERESCDAIKGLLAEGEEVLDAKGDESVIDAALIAAAQRVEHYEMAGYGCARAFANRLGHGDAARILQKTLDEEGMADKILTAIAEREVNTAANAAKN